MTNLKTLAGVLAAIGTLAACQPTDLTANLVKPVQPNPEAPEVQPISPEPETSCVTDNSCPRDLYAPHQAFRDDTDPTIAEPGVTGVLSGYTVSNGETIQSLVDFTIRHADVSDPRPVMMVATFNNGTKWLLFGQDSDYNLLTTYQQGIKVQSITWTGPTTATARVCIMTGVPNVASGDCKDISHEY